MSHPWINSQLISAASSGKVSKLLSMIEAHTENMNIINISTAFHRLAKLTSGDAAQLASLRENGVFVALLKAANTALVCAEAADAQPQCQAVSNIVWSLATLQVVDLQLLKTAAVLSRTQLDSFKPFELSSILWAFAKLVSVAQAGELECCCPVFIVAARFIPDRVEVFSFRCSVMIAWAFASMAQKSAQVSAIAPEFLGAMVEQMTLGLPEASCQELASIAWSFGAAGARHKDFLQGIAVMASQQTASFEAEEFAMLISALADAGVFHAELFEHAVAFVRNSELQPRCMADFLQAFSRWQPQHKTTKDAVLALLPRCAQRLDMFEPRDLSTIALVTAKCFSAWSVEVGEAQDESASGTNSTSVPGLVRAFFVAVLPWAMSRLQDFSGPSLASLAAAFLAVNVERTTALYPALGRAVIRAAPQLDDTALLQLLRLLPGAPQGACDFAVRSLFAESARRVDALRLQDRQALASICSAFLGMPARQGSAVNEVSCEEIRSWCLTLTRTSVSTAASPPGLEVAQGIGPEGPCAVGMIGTPPGLGQVSFPDGPAYLVMDSAGRLEAVQHVSTRGFTNIAKSDLPPALSIIPLSVSDEKLAKWRWDYQRYRMGGVRGSKGEVSSTEKQDPDEQEEEPDAARNTMGALPPPLDILPSSISANKLTRWRLDYQSFRVGKASGAKGEVQDIVS